MNSLVSPAPRTALDLDSILCFGRRLADYRRFFLLADDALRDRDVLDVGAGSASFAREAAACGARVVAVDPVYRLSYQALQLRVRSDFGHMMDKVAAVPAAFNYGRGTVSDFEDLRRQREAAMDAFLADYPSGRPTGRYRYAALPRLPFADASFDLVLCGHLLCLYADHLDFEFHRAAITELVRVSRGEVRIHPVLELNGRPYRDLDRLRQTLDAQGIASELRPTDYEVRPGGHELLALYKSPVASGQLGQGCNLR